MEKIPVSSSLDEETARAELYGVLSALFVGPPAAPLLHALKHAPTQAPAQGAYLEAAWTDVVSAAQRHSAQQVQDEYDALFGGVGRPEVLLFGSHYLSGFLNEKPLIALRGELARLGLTRQDGVNDTEDHIAYLCEVMRYLIAGDDLAVANLTNQKRFFTAHLQVWTEALSNAITTHPKASFYAAVSKLLHQFMQVEQQGFDMIV
jgi:TorA maturation chaperone TorD